jgi:hypothetical protein
MQGGRSTVASDASTVLHQEGHRDQDGEEEQGRDLTLAGGEEGCHGFGLGRRSSSSRLSVGTERSPNLSTNLDPNKTRTAETALPCACRRTEARLPIRLSARTRLWEFLSVGGISPARDPSVDPRRCPGERERQSSSSAVAKAETPAGSSSSRLLVDLMHVVEIALTLADPT